MSNTPSKAEIEALVKRHGATSYRNRADTQHPAYGFTEDGLNGLIDEVLAKWGTPAGAGEPVMWAYQYSDGSWHDASATEHSAGMKPLYPGPQPTQPQAGAVPQGWKAVPVNPTPEMWKAAKSVPDPNPPYPPHYGLVWDAMLAASPTPPVEQPAITSESGAVYAELPEEHWLSTNTTIVWNEDSMRDFADRTHALRMQADAS